MYLTQFKKNVFDLNMFLTSNYKKVWLLIIILFMSLQHYATLPKAKTRSSKRTSAKEVFA